MDTQCLNLEPCPFCGGQPEVAHEYIYTDLRNGGWSWFVRCNYLKGGCGAKGPGCLSMEEAVDAWQKRYQMK